MISRVEQRHKKENKGQSWDKLERWVCLFWGALVGALAFLCIYGVSVLDVTYDGWILNQYIERDIVQHYAGWLIFRASEWAWPLGMANDFAMPVGGAISFTDSIPVVAILLKVIEGILPETFQYFGWYILGCFMLQGVASVMLVRLFTKNIWVIALTPVLFVCSPIMIERAFRHTALASHWLILFALYYYIKTKRENYSNYHWQFIVLNLLVVMIHPYFLPMVMAILAATMLEFALYHKQIIKPLGFVAVNILSALLIGYVIGLFGTVSSGAAERFGYYSMNLNAPINPVSLGVDQWSVFLPQLPQTFGNYDGFNYLGFGVILFAVLILVHSLIQAIGHKSLWLSLKSTVQQYYGLILVFLVLYFFALSNVITLHDEVVLQYGLPDFIMRICEVFRASSRMFYPIFYSIFLLIVVYLAKNFSKIGAAILMLCLVGVQLYDLSPAFAQKYDYFNEGQIVADDGFQTEPWEFIGQNYAQLQLLEHHFDYSLAAFVGKHQMKSNVVIVNRGSYETIWQGYEQELSMILAGEAFEKDTVYVTSNGGLAQELTWNLPVGYAVYDLGNYYGILYEKQGISGEKIVPLSSGMIRCAADSNVHWDHGVNRWENILLMERTVIKQQLLQPGVKLKVGDTVREIEKVTTSNEDWLHIYLVGDETAMEFAYPNEIEVIH